MRDKLDPADGVKGRERERTEGGESEDKKTHSGNRVEEKEADAKKNRDRKSTRLNSSHSGESRMPSSA